MQPLTNQISILASRTPLPRSSRRLALAVVCCFPLLFNLAAAEPTITAPEGVVPIGGFADVEISGLENPNTLAWDIEPETRVRASSPWGRPTDAILSIQSNAEGKWSLAVAYVEGGKTVIKLIPILVGTQQPVPVPPDPGPIPDPIPPSPQPVPLPGPIRTLILRETASAYPLHQDVLMSTELRNYLNEKSAKGIDGKTPEWRMWDDDYTDAQMELMQDHWRRAYADAKAKANGSYPWLYISNGRDGYSGPLPDTEDATLILLKKYGGE